VATFFGFKSEHQVLLHNQIFDLLWAGEGRWTFDEIYTMPLRIRKLWVSRINRMRSDAEAQSQEQKIKQKSGNIQRGPSKN
tara:strand:+ start:513 stop:755 length:243 start_codon:yes stop_codon:yes gene_type:complete